MIKQNRLKEKLKESPLTVESMGAQSIRETPASDFYEALGHLKGVDVTSASLGFRIVNTRGFNSTSPVRTLQVIDGGRQPISRSELLPRKFFRCQ